MSRATHNPKVWRHILSLLQFPSLEIPSRNEGSYAIFFFITQRERMISHGKIAFTLCLLGVAIAISFYAFSKDTKPYGTHKIEIGESSPNRVIRPG
jgi:hypothetical protein